MSPPRQDAILLIEDDDDEAELALSALREGGHRARVELARDGEAALALLFGSGGREGLVRTLRLILLDMKLPKLGGLEVIRRIRADPLGRSVPIVVLTSSQLETDVAESYLLGANSYLVKPVGFKEFSRMLAETRRYWLELNRTPD